MTSSNGDEFADVDPGSGKENPCTPKVDANFVGLKINAPQVIKLVPGHREPVSGVFGRVMVCGVYRFPSSFCDETGGVPKAIVVVAVNTVTHKPYTSNLVQPRWVRFAADADLPKSNGSARRAGLAGQMEKGFFNVNLLDYLDLPEKPATYQVFATLGEHKSNVVTVQVKGPQE